MSVEKDGFALMVRVSAGSVGLPHPVRKRQSASKKANSIVHLVFGSFENNSYPMVMGVCNVEITVNIKGDAIGSIQSCLFWRAIVTVVARNSTSACEGGDVAIRINFPDTTVERICNEEIAFVIDIDINREA